MKSALLAVAYCIAQTRVKAEAAVMRRDSAAIAETAHALKGSIGYFAVQSVYQVTCQLEEMGREGKLGGLDETYKMLKTQIEWLIVALAALRQEQAPGVE